MGVKRKIAAIVLVSGLSCVGNVAVCAKEVAVPLPLGLSNKLQITADTSCEHPGGKGYVPREQTFAFRVKDVDSPALGSGGFDLYNYLPHNTATLTWKNKTTGRQGTAEAVSIGREIYKYGVFTGTGEIEATLTVTRSLAPPQSSIPWFSVSHTEHFHSPARDAATCSTWKG